MNKVLYIILISLFSLTIISCAKKSSTSSSASENTSSASDNTTTPVVSVLAEVTPVPNQISNSTPEYTFSLTKVGDSPWIRYGGHVGELGVLNKYMNTCWGGRGGKSQYENTYSANSGNNTINFYLRGLQTEPEDGTFQKKFNLV